MNMSFKSPLLLVNCYTLFCNSRCMVRREQKASLLPSFTDVAKKIFFVAFHHAVRGKEKHGQKIERLHKRINNVETPEIKLFR